MKQNLEFEYVETKKLVPYVRNAKTHSETQIKKIMGSIAEFGFIAPIIIDKDNNVLAGHGRLLAADRLGLEKVPCIREDHLTETQRKAYILADNRIGELAGWDNELLKVELEELKIDDFDLEMIGFDDNFVDDLLKDEKDSKWESNSPGALSDRFLIPPFDIWDARKGEWQKRKKIWNLKIDDNGSSRGTADIYGDGSLCKTCKTNVSILDPVLSEIINLWFTPTQENIKTFDCFAGDTVFGFVSAYLGNHFTGIELRKEQVDFNNARVQGMTARYICEDGRNIDKHIEKESQDLLFSCPPYFDLEIYSDLPNDASNQNSYENFLSILDEAFSKAITCLKDNRFAVIVVGDIRGGKDDSYYNFPGDIINIFRKNGLFLYNNIKLLTPLGTAPYRASGYMRNRKTVHVYQDVLVFYKGDTTQIKKIFGDIEVAELEADNESTNF